MTNSALREVIEEASNPIYTAYGVRRGLPTIEQCENVAREAARRVIMEGK